MIIGHGSINIIFWLIIGIWASLIDNVMGKKVSVENARPIDKLKENPRYSVPLESVL